MAWKSQYPLRDVVREGQQGEDIIEAYGLSLHGEKQSLQGENKDLKGKAEEGVKGAKGGW